MPNHEPATVVAKLLAFGKEPVRYRNRLTHGKEPFPGGLIVFRLAQGRFPQGLLRDLSEAERERIRRAAMFFIRQVCFWEGATHYQVLCVPPDATRETIKEHYQGLIALIHPDRQDVDSGRWPADFAPRANLAYEVLSDDLRRAEYDAGLRKLPMRLSGPDEIEATLSLAASVEVSPKPGGASLWRGKLRRHTLPVLAVVAALFYAQVWWAAEYLGVDDPLTTHTSFRDYYRWTKEAFLSGMQPKFLAPEGEPAEVPVKARHEAIPEEEESFFSRLARTIREAGNGMATAEPLAVPAPAPAAPASAPKAAQQPSAARKETLTPRAAGAVPAPGPVASSGPRDMAALAGPHAADMELLVVRLKAFYEAGDVRRLLDLFDLEKAGFWDRTRLRADFDEFFRATSSRRLRINWIKWDGANGILLAKGEAVLSATYQDPPGTVERVVPIEMTVHTDGAIPKIARLSLFPHD